MSTKRTPTKATKITRAFGRLTRLECQIEDVQIAWEKAIAKHKERMERLCKERDEAALELTELKAPEVFTIVTETEAS